MAALQPIPRYSLHPVQLILQLADIAVVAESYLVPMTGTIIIVRDVMERGL